jgi:hypothetical protein
MAGVTGIRRYAHGAVDAEKECSACEARNHIAWSLLMTHLSRAYLDCSYPKPFAVAADPELYVFIDRDGHEGVAYHYCGDPLVLEVLAVGPAQADFERGQFVSEAQRRKRESLK